MMRFEKENTLRRGNSSFQHDFAACSSHNLVAPAKTNASSVNHISLAGIQISNTANNNSKKHKHNINNPKGLEIISSVRFQDMKVSQSELIEYNTSGFKIISSCVFTGHQANPKF